MVSHTGRNKKWVREDILQWLPFPVLEEIKYEYRIQVEIKTGTERHREYGIWLPVLEKLNKGTGSRTLATA